MESDDARLGRVRQYIEQLTGPEGARLADALLSRKEATDTELAEELGEKPSHIRRILYDLYEARIAEYHKEKDKETGWLTFYWQIDPRHAYSTIADRTKRELAELNRALQFEESHEFFICPQGGERFDFERATEHSFQCPEHASILEQHDNHNELEQLRVRVEALRRDVESAS